MGFISSILQFLISNFFFKAFCYYLLFATNFQPLICFDSKPQSEMIASMKNGEKILNCIGMEFNRIPAGTFIMGSNDYSYPEECPEHKVTISRPFFMGIFKVSWREYPKKPHDRFGGGIVQFGFRVVLEIAD